MKFVVIVGLGIVLICVTILAIKFGSDTLVVLALLTLIGIAVFVTAFGWLELRGKKISQDAIRLESLKIHSDNAALLIPNVGVMSIPNSRYANLAPINVAAPIPPILPGPEPISFKPLTLADTLSSLPRNQLAVCFGVDPITGQPEISDLYGTMHTLIGASTGMGKSCLLAGLLTQLIATNRPDLFGLYICDVKRTTGRWFENHANRVAYTLSDILQTVIQVDRELKRRMERLLTNEKPVILVVEEALVTRKMFGKLDDKKASMNQFAGALDNLALLGREFGIYLYWASQIDYASPEINDIKGQFAARLAGSLMPTAAQAMGFQSKSLINQLWQERKPGQFLIESPAGSRLILTPRLDLKGGEVEKYLPRAINPQEPPKASYPYSDVTTNFSCHTEAHSHATSQQKTVDAKYRVLETSAPEYYDSLPTPGELARAFQAWCKGANSVRKLEVALPCSNRKARQLIDQMKAEGLIPM